jgi:outer membrane immunogenic protein
MRPIIVAVMLSLVNAVPALAADVAVPMSPPPTAPTNYYPAAAPINWGGLYVGINGGYAFGSSDWSNAGVSTGSFGTNGAVAGGTAGFNYASFGGLMFGVEGDVDWSGLNGGSSVAACVGLGAPAGTTCRTQSDWLVTARMRAGYAFDRVLIFGTGGAAIAGIQVGLSPPGVYQSLAPQLGWTAGAGIEFAFADNWTAKVEYLYVDLGTVSCATGAGCGVLSAASLSLTESLVRVGVNYKIPW